MTRTRYDNNDIDTNLPRLSMDLLQGMGVERFDAPMRCMQFGEGNFLRAFVDPFIQELNERGFYRGSIAVVQPIPRGQARELAAQDGLYTLFLRGLEGDTPRVQSTLIQSIQQVLNPYEQWETFLALGRSETLRFVFSNTTEAGITFRDCAYPNHCPESFPAKVARLLHERYQACSADPSKGLVFLPCELIEANGDALRECVLRHLQAWGLTRDFQNWVKEACVFCNTLVDRIVPGYPADEAPALEQQQGYRDPLMVEAEPFGLWVIQAPRDISQELPLHRCESGTVRFVSDIRPYRTLKVRILNGAHTILASLGVLCGISTVREAMGDPMLHRFLLQALQEEILPTLPFPAQEKEAYQAEVLNRFQNPFSHHPLISINLNAISKFRTRVLPSLLEGAEAGSGIDALAFSLAALATLYRGELQDGKLQGMAGGQPYHVLDERSVLEFFERLHRRHEADPVGLIPELLAEEALWGRSLESVPSLQEHLRVALPALIESPRRALAQFLQKPSVHPHA